MRVLALEPYYGGSHKAFLDGWITRSRHEWTTLTLPPHKWKWRMRHGAITFADAILARFRDGHRWDVLICSDMLNLAELLGLARDALRDLPAVAYFHENQITYPIRHESERDYHFGFTNITTASAASAAWFNSAFHRDTFLAAIPAFVARMPDQHPYNLADRIREKSSVQWPAIDTIGATRTRPDGPLHILWASRWEHDKNPELLFDALRRLRQRRVAFRLSVIGEQFREAPPIFAWARDEYRDVIEHWGFQESREAYESALRAADVFVSTADHEFFGLAALEAISAGARPLLPNRLAYPEVLAACGADPIESLLYDGTPGGLSEALVRLAQRRTDDDATGRVTALTANAARIFDWSVRAEILDQALAEVTPTGPRPLGHAG
jgi:glycosyltransferase involved in cell wall biosynthesis